MYTGMEKTRALILTGFGINCSTETMTSYRQLNVNAEIVHLSEVFMGEVDFLKYDIVNLPGGFSYGDNLGAGRVLANLIKYKKLPSGETVFKKLLEYLDENKYLIGICNGFQVLLALGLLPGLDENNKQQATLAVNEHCKFEDRWIYCKIPENSVASTIFSKKIYSFPIRHKEGKLVVIDSNIEKQIVNKNLSV